jgi:uncharacterized protein YecT (DUF1311 family)
LIALELAGTRGMNRLARTIAVTGLLFSIAPVAAEDFPGQPYGEEYQKCNNQSTADIVMCVDARVREWDGRLAAAYKKLMQMTPAGKRREGLKAAQELWIKFRAANCGWYAGGEGTISRIEGVECMRSMTAARALELEFQGEEH